MTVDGIEEKNILIILSYKMIYSWYEFPKEKRINVQEFSFILNKMAENLFIVNHALALASPKVGLKNRSKSDQF